MRRGLAVCMLAITTWALEGCAARPRYQNVITHWGTYTVYDGVRFQVLAMGMTGMRFEMRHVPSNRVLIRDYGRDTDGWFFVYDDKGSLWAHWADVGLVVWVPRAGGFQKHVLSPRTSFLGDLPPEVSKRLPGWARKSRGTAPGTSARGPG